jgi:hypothetical protein
MKTAGLVEKSISLLEKGFENANGLENGWLVRKRQKVESIVNMETG